MPGGGSPSLPCLAFQRLDGSHIAKNRENNKWVVVVTRVIIYRWICGCCSPCDEMRSPTMTDCNGEEEEKREEMKQCRTMGVEEEWGRGEKRSKQLARAKNDHEPGGGENSKSITTNTVGGSASNSTKHEGPHINGKNKKKIKKPVASSHR